MDESPHSTSQGDALEARSFGVVPNWPGRTLFRAANRTLLLARFCRMRGSPRGSRLASRIRLKCRHPHIRVNERRFGARMSSKQSGLRLVRSCTFLPARRPPSRKRLILFVASARTRDGRATACVWNQGRVETRMADVASRADPNAGRCRKADTARRLRPFVR